MSVDVTSHSQSHVDGTWVWIFLDDICGSPIFDSNLDSH